MENILKEKCLISRDGEGKLIPVKIILESLEDKPSCMMIPLTKGEFQQVVVGNIEEDEMLRTHIAEPIFTEEEFKFIKPTMYGT